VSTSAGGADQKRYLVDIEPPGAKPVKAVRKEAKDGEQVVVIGRIGGSQKPFVEGRAAFTIVDLALLSCSERKCDNCPTPWDYCCEAKEEIASSSLMVKLVDDQGKTLTQDAQQLLSLKPLQTVVASGRAKKDSDGNLVLLASAIHIRPGGPAKANP
jgi:hypothetical protein